ncbi:RDD family protein [Streptomyces sp. NPDC059445]|uniref:RDD family protein n=1 Tax=Streptomyces sp. NPDC059445 TaxID=3346832 RepID=UPI0036AA421D
MSAPTPAPGDDRPREGYYPDPSIPGYVRYWNGAAWVPGTSRPAPSGGEALSPPAAARPAQVPAPASSPEFSAARGQSGAPAVEETGPHFFDEDPEPPSPAPAEPHGSVPAEPHGAVPEQPHGVGTGEGRRAASAESQHGSRPEPAASWGADRSQQSGFGGGQDRRVSWGAPKPSGALDPRSAGFTDAVSGPDGASARTDGTTTIPPADSGAATRTPASPSPVVFRRPTGPVPSTGPEGEPGAGGTSRTGSASSGGAVADPVPAAGDTAYRAPSPRTERQDGGTPPPSAPGVPTGSGPAAASGASSTPAGAGQFPAAAGSGPATAPAGSAGSAAPAGFGPPVGSAPSSAPAGAGSFAAPAGSGQAHAAAASAGSAPSGTPAGGPLAAPAGSGTSSAPAGSGPFTAPPGSVGAGTPAAPAPAAGTAAASGTSAAPGGGFGPATPGAVAPGAGQVASGPGVPQQPVGATPMASGAGGGQPSWAQQVHQLAGDPADEGQRVAPWKPPVDDVFQAAARRQAAARPAGLGRRLAARLLDTLVIAGVTAAAAVPLGTRAADHIDEKIDAAKLSGEKVTVWLLDATTASCLGAVLAVLLVFGVLYEVLPTAKWGRTLGKKLCGIEVRDIEGHEPPTFGRALGRWLVLSVPSLLVVGLVGVVWGLFDKPWSQCWHDKAAHTFVAGPAR